MSREQEELVERGRLSYEWAKKNMRLFDLAERHIREEIRKNGRNPFSKIRIAACLHISKETSVFISSLANLEARVRLVAANPLSSQVDIVSYLSSKGIDVRARRNGTVEQYEKDIVDAARSEPNLIVDDGGELHVAYSKFASKKHTCFGGTDETTSGTRRLRALERNGLLRYPAIAANDASTKHIFDNKYGTGQSAMDGLIRSTGLLLAGKIIVVGGMDGSAAELR